MTFPRLKHFLSTPMSYGVLKPDKYEGNDGVPLVRIMDVDQGKVAEEKLDKVSPAQSVEFSRTILREGDLVCSVVGTLGETFIVPSSLEGANLSRALARIQLTSQTCTRYVQYCISSPEFETFIDLHTEGTAQRVMNLGTLAELQIPIRDPIRQERIANFLDEKTARIDALIAEKEQLLSASKELFEAKLGTAVVEGVLGRGTLTSNAAKGYDAVRSDWALVPLKHLASSSGGMTPSKDKPSYWDGCIPWVSPKDMKRFELADSIDHVTQAALTETSLRLHDPDAVLVVVRGMILAHTFPVALNLVPVTINQDMKALRPTGRISSKYLAWMLRGLQPLMLSLTEESAHGTKALRTDQWANQPVPVPSPEEQTELVALFERWIQETEHLCAHLQEHIDRLREYRSSLISAAVTGQLDINAYQTSAELEAA